MGPKTTPIVAQTMAGLHQIFLAGINETSYDHLTFKTLSEVTYLKS